MIGFAILCIGVGATVAALVSGTVGLLCAGADRWLTRLAPEAQSRLLFGAALAPVVVMAVLFAGWMVDVFVLGCTAHRCLHDHTRSAPGVTGTLLGGAFLIRVWLAVGRSMTSLLRARRARIALDTACRRGPAGTKVIPLAEPHAFVVGVLRPRVYVSRGFLAAASRRDLRSVLAHERAHAERRDPLRRLVASLALAYHLPGIATLLERRLLRAHEMAADAAAARVIGNGQRVAEALVRFARLRVSHPALSAATSWFGGDLEARVRTLLAPGAYPNRPQATSLVGCVVALLLAAVAAADSIHSGGEMLLALLDR
jgi:Zn-dependent protease with chaperone function